MNFAYIAINVRNFNCKADFRENATSVIIKVNTGLVYYYYGHSGYKLKTTDLIESTNIKS